jgi:hypothetical protein
MGNSSIQIRQLVDDAQTFAEIAPVLPTGGYWEMIALSVCNDVMTAMLMGTPNGEPFNWKWNRILVPPFYVNSYQQDYFLPGLVNLGWLEGCTAVNQSNTTFPKQIYQVEVRRDIQETSNQYNGFAKTSWMQVDTMMCGVWGQSQIDSLTGLQNPGPNVVYTSPVGQTTMPANPITCVKDAFGNFWVVTTYGTCGATNPFISNLNPVFPTQQLPDTVATTATDGSVVWTAVNPKGQGIRLNPQPSQTGSQWRVLPVGQARIPQFTSVSQYIDPVPDDFYTYFKQGFFAQCFRRSPDPKVRAKFPEEWAIWLKSLDNAVKQGSREMDDWGFFPATNVMDNAGYGYYNTNTPSNPYGPF